MLTTSRGNILRLRVYVIRNKSHVTFYHLTVVVDVVDDVVVDDVDDVDDVDVVL